MHNLTTVDPTKLETVDMFDLMMLRAAMAQAKEADAIWKFVQSQMFMKYGFSEGSKLDMNTGAITRAPVKD